MSKRSYRRPEYNEKGAQPEKSKLTELWRFLSPGKSINQSTLPMHLYVDDWCQASQWWIDWLISLFWTIQIFHTEWIKKIENSNTRFPFFYQIKQSFNNHRVEYERSVSQSINQSIEHWLGWYRPLVGWFELARNKTVITPSVWNENHFYCT